MKPTIRKIIKKIQKQTSRPQVKSEEEKLFLKYSDYTMVPEKTFLDNLRLCLPYQNILGNVVECGVWRGGMIAAIAEKIGKSSKYYLCDSFEGLPTVEEIDGTDAKAWQNDKNGDFFFDNCTAEIGFSTKAMELAGIENYQIVKGWFSETLPSLSPGEIKILRLDGDWYQSTMDCLTNLYDYVIKDGIIIIDDYYMWEGCSKAVHDFLSSRKSSSRISQTPNGVCYITKK